MYVCICNAVTERQVRDLVEQGFCSLQEIQARTGCAGTCGHCIDHAEQVIQAAAEQRFTPGPALPMAL